MGKFQQGHTRVGGRKKGTGNGPTEEVRRLAKTHSKKAIERLAYLMDNAEDERAQVAASNSILDRAYGKATQTNGIDPENNRIEVVILGDDAKL